MIWAPELMQSYLQRFFIQCDSLCLHYNPGAADPEQEEGVCQAGAQVRRLLGPHILLWGGRHLWQGWRFLEGEIFLIACVLTAGEQGGFRCEEHPGLSDFNSWVCSGRLPRSRHLPVQFWNCPTQVSKKHLGFKNNHERVSRKPITLVVGAPIPAKQIANPSEEDVEKLHAKYVRHLQRLYKEHNPYPEIKLVIGWCWNSY